MYKTAIYLNKNPDKTREIRYIIEPMRVKSATFHRQQSGEVLSKNKVNWISLTNFRQFTHINFNLFHYAGNNPVKYVDPTGAFEIDNETGSIIFDVTSKKDTSAANKEFKKNEKIKTCVGRNSNGINIIFNDRDTMQHFADAYDKSLLNTLDSLFSNICDAATTTSILGDGSQIQSITDNIGNDFTIGAILIDTGKGIYHGYKWHETKDREEGWKVLDGISDALIDAIGLGGPIGGSISITLKYGKKEGKFASEQLARYKKYKETSLLNEISNSFFGLSLFK